MHLVYHAHKVTLTSTERGSPISFIALDDDSAICIEEALHMYFFGDSLAVEIVPIRCEVTT
jgi:hypothetical protein